MEPSETPDIICLKEFESDQLFVSLDSKFQDCYNSKPSFFVRVPGRVNLIGEHIDYCGYSVLPMALEQSILMAIKLSEDSSLKIVNVDPKYKPYQCHMDKLEVDISHGVHWYSYVICGVKGIIELSNKKERVGMLIAVVGNVLPNSGLSSSSALVCAAALATSHAYKLILTKQELASSCARSERYIGTEGGGMDQAIAFLANSGCAKHISFKPLKATDVKIPFGLAIVVGHSCSELNKAADVQFNQRVAECRLASLILAKESGLPNWKDMAVLADVQTELDQGLPDMILLTSQLLPKDSYAKNEICKMLELSSNELDSLFLPENTRNIQSFKLQQRATHVFAEALRVIQFKECCDSNGSGEALGKLMNLSHDSLRDFYECSHPQLDNLVLAARSSGALGARLTGAGWGGCMVALTTEEHVDILISSLKSTFYSTLQPEFEKHSFIFQSKPGKGAFIIQ